MILSVWPEVVLQEEKLAAALECGSQKEDNDASPKASRG